VKVEYLCVLFLVFYLVNRFYAWYLADMCNGTKHFLDAMYHDGDGTIYNAIVGTDAERVHVEM
jgi:hypothetical protein